MESCHDYFSLEFIIHGIVLNFIVMDKVLVLNNRMVLKFQKFCIYDIHTIFSLASIPLLLFFFKIRSRKTKMTLQV